MNILRHNYARCRPGWMVKTKRDGKQICKLFADDDYGGSRQAKQAASAFLAELDRTMPRWRQLRDERTGRPLHMHARRQRNNKSGIPGVFRGGTHHRGHLYPAWIAAWSDDRGPHLRKFHFHEDDENSEAAAFNDAVRLRKQMEARNIIAARGNALVMPDKR